MSERMTCPACQKADVAVVRVRFGGARRTSQGKVVPSIRLPGRHYVPNTTEWCPQGEQTRRSR